jgi:DNA-binding response OmpR family regulator
MLTTKIKRINSNIRMMVLTEGENDKTRVLEYGADEFTTKPISAKTILDKILGIY